MSEFFAMGGHALYVWSAWGLCIIFGVANLCLIRRRMHQAFAKVRRIRAGK